MRLKPEKIEQLADLVYDHLGTIDELKFGGEREAVTLLIRNVITENLKAEDDLEDEARRLLEEHEGMISRRNVNFDQILRKTKEKLARDRNMIL